MSLGEDLMKMSLDDRGHVTTESPKPPTLGEVKQSLKVRGKVYLKVTANYRLVVSCKTVDSLGATNGRASKFGVFSSSWSTTTDSQRRAPFCGFQVVLLRPHPRRLRTPPFQEGRCG